MDKNAKSVGANAPRCPISLQRWAPSIAVLALVTVAVASVYAGPATAADDRLNRPEDLIGTWMGKMMSVTPGHLSLRGIETTFAFTLDSSGTVRGLASFYNFDMMTSATGIIEAVAVEGQTVTFPLTYRGGAPGVDGTVGRYKLKFVNSDVLEGDSENRQTGSYLKLTIQRQAK